MNKFIFMKLKLVVAIFALFALTACVYGEKFTPDSGIFAYQELEVFEINGINFTVPTDYEVTSQTDSEMQFKHAKDKLKISVTDNGTIKKVKKDPSKNITAEKTMLGSQKGYLVDKNGTYTFSYKQDSKLIVIKSKDMSLMIGIMEMCEKFS